MRTPAVVVFDLGKVLVDFDYGLAARKIAARGRLSAAEVQKHIDASPLLFRYETGLIAKEQFYAEVCALTGFCGGLEEFSEFFSDIFTPIPGMVELPGWLRKRGIPTLIFSNTNDLAVGHIRRRFPFFGGFSGYVYSFEHGAMKPDHKLYEVVERMAGCAPEGILYLDDRLENIETGRARGWQVIHHQAPEATRAALGQFGLRPD